VDGDVNVLRYVLFVFVTQELSVYLDVYNWMVIRVFSCKFNGITILDLVFRWRLPVLTLGE